MSKNSRQLVCSICGRPIHTEPDIWSGTAAHSSCVARKIEAGEKGSPNRNKGILAIIRPRNKHKKGEDSTSKKGWVRRLLGL